MHQTAAVIGQFKKKNAMRLSKGRRTIVLKSCKYVHVSKFLFNVQIRRKLYQKHFNMTQMNNNLKKHELH